MGSWLPEFWVSGRCRLRTELNYEVVGQYSLLTGGGHMFVEVWGFPDFRGFRYCVGLSPRRGWGCLGLVVLAFLSLIASVNSLVEECKFPDFRVLGLWKVESGVCWGVQVLGVFGISGLLVCG